MPSTHTQGQTHLLAQARQRLLIQSEHVFFD
jgi:hypothetical protein